MTGRRNSLKDKKRGLEVYEVIFFFQTRSQKGSRKWMRIHGSGVSFDKRSGLNRRSGSDEISVGEDYQSECESRNRRGGVPVNLFLYEDGETWWRTVFPLGRDMD